MFFKIGRFYLRVGGPKPTGLEHSFLLTGEDAEIVRRHLQANSVEWNPKPRSPEQGDRGPLGPLPPSDDTLDRE